MWSIKVTYKKSDVIEKGKQRVRSRQKVFRLIGILLVTIMPGIMVLQAPILFLGRNKGAIAGFCLGLGMVILFFVIPGILLIVFSKKSSSDPLLEGCEEYASMRNKNIDRGNSINEKKAERLAKRKRKTVHYRVYNKNGFNAKELYNLLLKNDEVLYPDYHVDCPFIVDGYSKPSRPKEDPENDFEQYMEWDEMLDDD